MDTAWYSSQAVHFGEQDFASRTSNRTLTLALCLLATPSRRETPALPFSTPRAL